MLMFFSGLLFGSIHVIADGNDDYSAGNEPPRLTPWPDLYNNFQVLPDSQSPENRFAFIYPKHSIVEEKPLDTKLFLISQKPFRVLTEIPIKGAILAENALGSYQVNWAPNSSAAVFIVGRKWGPDAVFVTPVVSGKAGQVLNLTQEVWKLVWPDYQLSGAPRFNDQYEFIFDANDQIRNLQGVLLDESTQWTVNSKGLVTIKCICTNDPKHLDKKDWEIIFEGIWDIGQKKFLHYKIKHISQDRLLKD